ncbi:MAG: DUF4124 domain-containing protein [Gammaproteobacteria bacterium]|nr:DUF4124 domain-containing protein [Gammaproteobacteria bacterium]
MKCLLFVALLFTSVTSYAEMYRWVDEFGKVRIGERPTGAPAPVDVDKPGSKKISDVNEQVNTPPVVLPSKKVSVASEPTNMAASTTPSPSPTPKAVVAPKPVMEPPQKNRNPNVKKTVVNKPVAKKLTAKPTVKKPIVKKLETKNQVTKKTSVSKPVVKKIATKKFPLKAKKLVVKKQAAKKALKKTAANKSTKKSAPVSKKTPITASDEKRNEDMCGVYMSYVRDYEDRVKNCSASLCDIYERALERYQKKQKSYCKN